jgi:hypothetical protein
MTLPDAGGAEKQDVGLVAQVLTGGERLDLPPVGLGLKAPVEVLERLPRGQPGELEHRRDAALILALELAGEQEVEEGERTEGVARGLFDELGSAAAGYSKPSVLSFAITGSSVVVPDGLGLGEAVGARLGAGARAGRGAVIRRPPGGG